MKIRPKVSQSYAANLQYGKGYIESMIATCRSTPRIQQKFKSRIKNKIHTDEKEDNKHTVRLPIATQCGQSERVLLLSGIIMNALDSLMQCSTYQQRNILQGFKKCIQQQGNQQQLILTTMSLIKNQTQQLQLQFMNYVLKSFNWNYNLFQLISICIDAYCMMINQLVSHSVILWTINAFSISSLYRQAMPLIKQIPLLGLQMLRMLNNCDMKEIKVDPLICELLNQLFRNPCLTCEIVSVLITLIEQCGNKQIGSGNSQFITDFPKDTSIPAFIQLLVNYVSSNNIPIISIDIYAALYACFPTRLVNNNKFLDGVIINILRSNETQNELRSHLEWKWGNMNGVKKAEQIVKRIKEKQSFASEQGFKDIRKLSERITHVPQLRRIVEDQFNQVQNAPTFEQILVKQNISCRLSLQYHYLFCGILTYLLNQQTILDASIECYLQADHQISQHDGQGDTIQNRLSLIGRRIESLTVLILLAPLGLIQQYFRAFPAAKTLLQQSKRDLIIHMSSKQSIEHPNCLIDQLSIRNQSKRTIDLISKIDRQLRLFQQQNQTSLQIETKHVKSNQNSNNIAIQNYRPNQSLFDHQNDLSLSNEQFDRIKSRNAINILPIGSLIQVTRKMSVLTSKSREIASKIQTEGLQLKEQYKLLNDMAELFKGVQQMAHKLENQQQLVSQFNSLFHQSRQTSHQMSLCQINGQSNYTLCSQDSIPYINDLKLMLKQMTEELSLLFTALFQFCSNKGSLMSFSYRMRLIVMMLTGKILQLISIVQMSLQGINSKSQQQKYSLTAQNSNKFVSNVWDSILLKSNCLDCQISYQVTLISIIKQCLSSYYSNKKLNDNINNLNTVSWLLCGMIVATCTKTSNHHQSLLSSVHSIFALIGKSGTQRKLTEHYNGTIYQNTNQLKPSQTFQPIILPIEPYSLVNHLLKEKNNNLPMLPYCYRGQMRQIKIIN